MVAAFQSDSIQSVRVVKASICVCEREREKEPLNEFSCREPVRHDTLNVIRCLYEFLLAGVTQETSMSGPVLHA